MTIETEATDISAIATYQGRMAKSIGKMIDTEREEFYANLNLRIRSHLFSIGQPLVYDKNGQIVAEYADGTITVIR